MKYLDNCSEYEFNSFRNENTHNNNDSKIDINKIKSRLSSKMNFKYRNTFTNISMKKDNYKLKTFQLLKTHNKSNILSSKTFMNPFSTIYCRKKKTFLI